MDRRDFVSLVWLVTGVCNFSCPYCFYDYKKHINSKERMERELSGEELSSILLKSKYLTGLKKIDIAGGEPFLKKDLNIFIRIIEQHKIVSQITTNGYCYDNIVKLVESMDNPQEYLEVAVSIDCFEETHNDICGVNDAFLKAMKSIDYLLENDIKCQINTVATKANYDEIFSFRDFVKSKQINHAIIPLANSPFEDESHYTTQEMDRLLELEWNKYDRKYLLSGCKYKIKKCHAAVNGALIDYDGSVYACATAGAPLGNRTNSRENFLLGNLLEDSFDDIINSKRTSEVYEKTIKSCHGCYNSCEITREGAIFDFYEPISKADMQQFYSYMPYIMYPDNKYFTSEAFYDLESLESGTKFRWMRGTETKVFIRSRVGQNLKLVFEFLNFIGNKDLNISIKLNESFVLENRNLEASLDKQKVEVQLERRYTQKNEVIEVSIILNKFWKSIYPDTRELGIGFISMGIL